MTDTNQKSGVETEKKLIIEMPQISDMARMPSYSADEMVQTYLASPEGVTHRVRCRVHGGAPTYTETKKVRISAMSAIEDERVIGEDEYRVLLANADEKCHPVLKTRHSFAYDGHTVEIDVYPQWSRSCVLEVELASEDEDFSLPPFIRVIADVTGRREFSNAAMARSFPEEIRKDAE